MSYRPICDVWWLTRARLKGGVKRYGSYLGGFPERARALLGATIDDPVLHVCGGLARLYPYSGGFGPNDRTLDLDPATAPDYQLDARGPLPAGFKAMLADPPYTPDDADKYLPGLLLYPKPGPLVKAMLDALLPGQRCGIIHYVVPSPPKGTRFVACVAVGCGFNNRLRAFSVFEKGAGRPAPPVGVTPTAGSLQRWQELQLPDSPQTDS